MRKKRWLILAGTLAALVSLAFIVAACGGDDGDGGDGDADGAGGGAVAVGLDEFSVNPSPDTIAAGTVTFNVSNDGAIVHNFRVIRTDLAADVLPTDAGMADESQLDVVATIPDFDPGGTEEVTATLEPGSYVLICNFVGHYQSGTFAAFTVE